MHYLFGFCGIIRYMNVDSVEMRDTMEWTDERKNFIRNLIPNKRFLFMNIGEDDLIVHIRKPIDSYNYLIMALNSKNAYIICEANLHYGVKTISFKKAKDYFCSRITPVARGLSINGYNSGLYERFFIVPFGKIEEFSEKYEELFESAEVVNSLKNMRFGYYDQETNSIKIRGN